MKYCCLCLQTWRKDQDAQDFLDKQEVDQQEVEAGERDQQNPNPQRPPEDKMTDQTGGEGGSAGLSAGAASGNKTELFIILFYFYHCSFELGKYKMISVCVVLTIQAMRCALIFKFLFCIRASQRV